MAFIKSLPAVDTSIVPDNGLTGNYLIFTKSIPPVLDKNGWSDGYLVFDLYASQDAFATGLARLREITIRTPEPFFEGYTIQGGYKNCALGIYSRPNDIPGLQGAVYSPDILSS